MMIRHGKYDDIPQFKSLWDQAFGDEKEYRDDFFRQVFRPEYTLCEEHNGRITAMLYKLPCTVWGETEEEAWYLYALATEKSHRGKGVMGRLIAAAKEEIYSGGDRLVFLIPATRGLVEYYRRFQFEPTDEIPAFYRKTTGEEAFCHPKAEDRPGTTAVFLERCGLYGEELDKAAELMSRRWDYTNCSVTFPEEIRRFCLKWLLGEKEACFYKIISNGETIGFFQGNIRNRVFHINYYGMSRLCFHEAGCAAAREDFSGIQVYAYENPDKDSFSEAASLPDAEGKERLPVSVCAWQEKRIYGVIPI